MKVWIQKWVRFLDGECQERRSLHVEMSHPPLFLREELKKEKTYGLSRLTPVICQGSPAISIESNNPVILGQLAFSEFGIWVSDWKPTLDATLYSEGIP